MLPNSYELKGVLPGAARRPRRVLRGLGYGEQALAAIPRGQLQRQRHTLSTALRIHSGFTWNFVNASLFVLDHNCPCLETWLAAVSIDSGEECADDDVRLRQVKRRRTRLAEESGEHGDDDSCEQRGEEQCAPTNLCAGHVLAVHASCAGGCI